MLRIIAVSLLALLTTACDEHRGQNISEFKGEYRYYKGIAEFFDCKSAKKYYLAKSGIHTELQSFYEKLNIKDHDVYIRVKGYLKEEEQMEGIDPIMKFVPVELIDHDTKRGCQRGTMQGG